MLLNLIAVHPVFQKEREVGVEIEERTRDETVEFKDRAFARLFFEIDAEDPAARAPAARGINEAEPVEPSRRDFIERNLARRGEIVAAQIEFESKRPGLAQIADVIAGDVVALVIERIDERPVRARALIGDDRLAVLQLGAVAEEGSETAERPALKARDELIVQRLFQADVNDSQAGKISVFRAERAVQNVYAPNQLRRQRLQLAQLTLPVALRGLILLHVVYQHFQPATHSAMVKVETEAANFERLAPTFVLSRVDARVERVEDLVVARKERVAVNGFIATVNRRVELRCRDDEAVVDFRDDELDLDPQIPGRRAGRDRLFNCHEVLAGDQERHGFPRNGQSEIAFGVALCGLFACRRSGGYDCSSDGLVFAGDDS